MTLHTTPSSALTAPLDHHALSQLLAAEAVLSALSYRAPLKVAQVSLRPAPALHYALAPDVWALQNNRELLEEVVMSALAAEQAAQMLNCDAAPCFAGRHARELLQLGLCEPEEQAVIDAYLLVLSARTRAQLRRHWVEIQVVAAGLREHGQLDGQTLMHRIRCAQGIRGSLLN